MKVLVTRPPPVPIDLSAALPGATITVSPHDRALAPDELAQAALGFDALVTQLTDRIDETFLAAHPQLRVVANVAVGHENLDATAGAARGVWMTNTPGVLTEATANLTIALLLSLTRRLYEGETLVRTGGWEGFSPGLLLGHDIEGRTLGLVGFGRIAQAVARRARAFGMRVLATSRRPIATALLETHDVEETDLPTLLGRADVVSLHAPLTAQTRGLIDAPALARMQPGSLLLNTARGPLLDEDALADALERGHLGGAALDVHAHEPRVHPRLLARADVVLLPHLGSATHETREAMLRLALRNVAAVLSGEAPPTPIVSTIATRPERHGQAS